MPTSFPPAIQFPTYLDTDYSLFLVYNSSESTLSVDNQPWADEVEINPVSVTDPEIWADNGFATIKGELFYYDGTEKNSNGKVYKLIRCARNLDGNQTQYNVAGTWVRGYVVAEHHNQIMQAILNMEKFVGYNYDTNVETLDYRIRNLRATPVIFDDFTCPDVTLNFEIISNDPVTGVVAQYLVQVSGTFNNYNLTFGDGTSTTSTSGTHVYAPNSTIDPVVTVSNNMCQIVQTPISRTVQSQPTPSTSSTTLNINVPTFTPPPPIVVPPVLLPSLAPEPPQIVFPCIDISNISVPYISIGNIDINVPSVISITSPNIPSIISITPVDIPSVISITPVDIPSIIDFGPLPSFPVIQFGPVPSIAPIDIGINITVDGSGIPSCISMCAPLADALQVDWGTPPVLNIALTSGLRKTTRKYTEEEMELMKELGDDFKHFFPEDQVMEIEDAGIGIPSEISIIPPKFENIKVVHDEPIPKEIVIKSESLVGLVPSIISIEHSLPEYIEVKMISDIPSIIKIDASEIPDSIKVTGIPETITLVGPESIRLTIDENIKVPLVYEGPPLEAKVKLEMPKGWNSDGEEGDYPCVMIVPCKK